MIRRATTADLAAIMRIEREVFPTDAWSEEMMRAELGSPHGWYAVLQLGGAVAGYGGLRSIRGAADADVQTLAVDPGARGRGHGRMLLRALLREAADRGAAEVFLEVRADNPVAQSLYRAEGFAQVGRRPRYYQPDDVDALVMRLDLPTWTANRMAPATASALAAATPAAGPGANPGQASAATPMNTPAGWCR